MLTKDFTINWIISTNDLLDSNVIEFFASGEIALKKKLEFLNKNIIKEKTIIPFDTHFIYHKKAFNELTESGEGQEIYFKSITVRDQITNKTLLALLYAFLNYSNHEENIKSHSMIIKNNFNEMDRNQKYIVSEYGDKKFVNFLNTDTE